MLINLIAVMEELENKRSRLSIAMKRDKKKRMTTKKKIWKKCRDFDIYGEAVQFTFKGEEAYKTTWGATVSLLVKILLLTYSLIKTVHMFTYHLPEVV